jgi:sugar phosphate isomerase/epimerase
MWNIGLGLNGWASGKNDMGIYQYSYPIDSILDHVVKMKYDGVEVTNLSIDPYPTNLRNINEIKKYKKKYFERNLRTAGVQAAAPRLGVSPNEEERLTFAKSVIDSVIFAKELDADYLGVWPGEKQAGISDWAVVQRLIDAWGKVFNILTKEKIELGDLIIVEEAEPVECFSNLTIAKTVIEEINNPNFKLLFDAAHINFMRNGDYINAIREFEGNIGCVHLADNDGTRWSSSKPGGMSSKHMIIGEGNINFMSLLRTLKDVKYNGWIQMDCWQNPNPFRCSETNKKVIDAIINDIKDGFSKL